jgi:hypothetical protein
MAEAYHRAYVRHMRTLTAVILALVVSTQALAEAPGDADALAASGRRRIATGASLIALGVLGWAASTAGTVLSIVGYVQDSRGNCEMGACDTMNTTGRWLSIGGTVVEIGGLAGGITLLVSGIRRKRAAQRLRWSTTAAPAY